MIKYQRLAGIKNKIYFPTVLKTGSLLEGLVPCEDCEGKICSRPFSLTSRWLSSACVFTLSSSVPVSTFLFL